MVAETAADGSVGQDTAALCSASACSLTRRTQALPLLIVVGENHVEIRQC
jgi:hypothetical protein